MAPFEEPPLAPAFKLPDLTPTEKINRFRSCEEGARVDPLPALPRTEKELNAVIALAMMKLQQLQEQVPDRSSSPRHDTYLVGLSCGQIKVVDPGTSSTETIKDRSIFSTEKLHQYYVEDEA